MRNDAGGNALLLPEKRFSKFPLLYTLDELEHICWDAKAIKGSRLHWRYNLRKGSINLPLDKNLWPDTKRRLAKLRHK